MSIERRERQIAGSRVHIVDEHAYAHTPIGCKQELARDKPAGRIITPDVALDVDRRLREPCAVHASRECVEPVWQETHARAAMICRGQRSDCARKPRSASNVVAYAGRFRVSQWGCMHVVQAYQPCNWSAHDPCVRIASCSALRYAAAVPR